MKIIIIFTLLFLNVRVYAGKYLDYVDAIFYQKKGDYKKSYDIIKKIAEKDKDPYLYKEMYNIAVKSNMSNEISSSALMLVEIDSKTSDNWLIYGNSLMGQGKSKEAEKAYKKAIEIDPDNVDAYYQLAVLYSDDVKEAEKYFKKIIEIDPSYKSDVYYNLAVLYSTKKDEKKMKEYLDLSIKEDPYNLKPYYFLAMYYENRKEYDKAIDAYNKLLEKEPNEEISNRIAELYLSKKDYDTSIKYLNKTLEINPENSKALLWLSLIYEEKKDFESAGKYLSRIKNFEEDPELVLKMSYYSIMKNDLNTALSILKKAHKKWPGNTAIGYYLALGLMDEGKRENDGEIKRLFEMVLSSAPDNYELRYNLGVVCERLNDVECFEKNFRYILNKNPDDHMVLNYLGYSLIDRGIKIDEAISMVEKALQFEPTNPAYLDSAGWGYYKKGDLNKAYEYLEKAVNYATRMTLSGFRKIDPLIAEHFGDVLLKLKQYNQSYSYFRLALLNGADNVKELKSKTLSFIDRITPDELINDIGENFIEARSISKFKLTLQTEYKKFLKTNKIRFSFDGFMDFYPDLNYFSITILDPLYIPVMKIEMSDNKYNFKTSIADKRIGNDILEDYAVVVGSILRFYNNLYYYVIAKPLKYQKYENRCFYYQNIIKDRDILKLCIDKNPFSFDMIEYQGDKFIKLRADDFKVLNAGKSKVDYNLYLPFGYEIDMGKTILTIDIDRIEQKNGK